MKKAANIQTQTQVTPTKRVVPKHISKTASVPVSLRVHAHVITLFPHSFDSYLAESIIARAQSEKRLLIHFYNPRDFVKPSQAQKGKDLPYLRVDDKPYGGGPGMVMQAEPVIKAIEKAFLKIDKDTAKVKSPKTRIVFLSPGGEQLTTDMIKSWIPASAKKVTSMPSKGSVKVVPKNIHIIFICGRYEGIDERVNKVFKTEKTSIGPFVTTGGELPTMLIIDTLARQIPGVLGNFDSREEERVASHEVYTRPEVLEYKNKKYKVPEVLLSGDHKKIEEWRSEGGKKA